MPADLDDARVGSFISALEDSALAACALRENNKHTGAWVITWIVDSKPDHAALAQSLPAHVAEILPLDKGIWEIEDVPDINWLEHSYRQFQPFNVGSFFIYGSHHKDPPPAGLISLQIDAATAFGSGEHGTTAGCLRALLQLAGENVAPRAILDMGTGSGILAIAAAKLWPCPVLAVDMDAEAVRVGAHHAAINGVSARIACHEGSDFDTDVIKARRPFDLILANILKEPLITLAPGLADALSSGGHAILSGLLVEQESEILECYAGEGLNKQARFEADGWVALLLRKSS